MLNYRIYGDLDSGITPLVVMHGLLGEMDNWRTFARKQQNEHPIIAIDMRNHGESPHVEGMSYPLMTDDVLKVLDALGLETVNLMGHSMGGKVAMWLALHQPARITKLIIVDIAPVDYPPRHQAILQAMLTMPLAGFKTRREADKWLAPTVKHPYERAFLLKNLAWDENRTFIWQCNLPEIGRNYLTLTAFPQTELTYNKSALFIRGGKSDYLTDENRLIAQQLFPQARLVNIAEAGHLPHVEQADEFINCVATELEH